MERRGAATTGLPSPAAADVWVGNHAFDTSKASKCSGAPAARMSLSLRKTRALLQKLSVPPDLQVSGLVLFCCVSTRPQHIFRTLVRGALQCLWLNMIALSFTARLHRRQHPTAREAANVSAAAHGKEAFQGGFGRRGQNGEKLRGAHPRVQAATP